MQLPHFWPGGCRGRGLPLVLTVPPAALLLSFKAAPGLIKTTSSPLHTRLGHFPELRPLATGISGPVCDQGQRVRGGAAFPSPGPHLQERSQWAHIHMACECTRTGLQCLPNGLKAWEGKRAPESSDPQDGSGLGPGGSEIRVWKAEGSTRLVATARSPMYCRSL